MRVFRNLIIGLFLLMTFNLSQVFAQITLTFPSFFLNAPTSLTTTSAVISWTSPTGGYANAADHYQVFVQNVPGFPKDVNSNSLLVTGLTPNTTYQYYVVANVPYINPNNGNSEAFAPQAGPDVFTTLTSIPSPPVSGTPSSVTTTSFTAAWGSSSYATGYYLDVATDAGFSSFVSGFNNKDVSNVTSYPVPGLTLGTPYYYRVRAYNTYGTSNNSNTISTQTLPAVAASAAAGTITGTTLVANWNAATGATGRGYRCRI